MDQMHRFAPLRIRSRWLLVLAVAMLCGGVYTAAQVVSQPEVRKAKRLILKDGTYQMATKWEVQGDRVRYLSAERFEWEELPNALVDWPATEKYERDHASGSVSQETREISAELEAERKEEEARAPTVAPGIRLPGMGGVFLLDNYKGQPQLVELVQSGGEINKQMGKNILRAALNPLASVKQSIELKGERAPVQAHEGRPVVFVDVEPGSEPAAGEKPLGPTQRFRLVRLQRRKDSRLVGNLKIALTGKVSQQQTFIPAEVQPFSSEWVRVTPTASLEPGEYALVEMLGEKQINLYVWDFGVDPNAPANPTAWKPVQPAGARTDESPELNKR